MQNVEARFVGREPGPLDLHAAEGAYVHVTVRRAAPRAAPVLELDQLARRLFDKVFDDVLLAQPVATADGVVEVIVEAIGRFFHTSGAAFGSHGVATHRVHLGY